MTVQNCGRVLSVGRVYCDLVFAQFPKMPVLGEEVYARDFGAHPGGGSFITASHLGAVGIGSYLCAVLPNGAFGQLLNDAFDKSGVDFSNCSIADESWGQQVTVAMAHEDDRAFLTRRGGGAIPPNCQTAIASKGFSHLHIAELATLLECPELIDWARAAGMTISLDCSWDVDAMSDVSAIGLIAQTDVFLPNLAEIKFILGDEFDVAADQIGDQFGSCAVVVKSGAQGATLFANGAKLNAPTQPATVVDATGAGDAFNAGYLAAWLSGEDAMNCLQGGHAQALTAISQVGGAALMQQDDDPTSTLKVQMR